MLDANGGFYLNQAINKNGLPITLQYYFIINQRKFYRWDSFSFVGRSYGYIKDIISNLLSVYLYFINRTSVLGIIASTGSYYNPSQRTERRSVLLLLIFSPGTLKEHQEHRYFFLSFIQNRSLTKQQKRTIYPLVNFNFLFLPLLVKEWNSFLLGF